MSSDIEIKRQDVVATIPSLEAYMRNFLQNLEDLPDKLLEGVSLVKVLGEDDQTEKFRESVIELRKLQHEAQLQLEELGRLQSTYRPNGVQATDFKALSNSQLEQALHAKPYDPHADTIVQDFDAMVGRQAEQPAGNDDDDDLVVMDNGGMLNVKCPLTAKPVLELEDPVQDPKGYVYDKGAILAYIKRHGGLSAPCPEQGTSHAVRLSELRPARKVLLQRKLRKMEGALGGAGGSGVGGGGATQGGSGQRANNENVIDVD